MAENRLNSILVLVIAAVFLDLLIGDPPWAPHPVQVIGRLIQAIQNWVEYFSRDSAAGLRVGGALLTIIVVTVSGSSGWFIESLAMSQSPLINFLGKTLLLIALTSALAAGSLRRSVKNVLNEIGSNEENTNLEKAREKLGLIVGRDIEGLKREEILRAAAETASENSVDGIFGPLFWIIIGLLNWEISSNLPGPLTLAWIYKASSTIDSMIGYKEGPLFWLGATGARLDDILTFVPCRLVLISLPITNSSWKRYLSVVRVSLKEGCKDESPNSGISEAIFAHCVGIKMGGINKYKNKLFKKPLLANKSKSPDKNSILNILELSLRLELIWLTITAIIIKLIQLIITNKLLYP